MLTNYFTSTCSGVLDEREYFLRSKKVAECCRLAEMGHQFGKHSGGCCVAESFSCNKEILLCAVERNMLTQFVPSVLLRCLGRYKLIVAGAEVISFDHWEQLLKS
jgi:hypothetical protein